MYETFDFFKEVAGLERYLGLSKGTLKNIPDYALEDAFDAISKVREMEKNSLFRPGLYYIMLADLCGNTAFNAAYGNKEGDLRIEWFHTAAIQSIGEIALSNYVAFSKTIGDAALLIFSAFQDVYNWSERFSRNLARLSNEYGVLLAEDEIISKRHLSRVKAFELRARRLVHLGEVSYKEDLDPLSLAVSQTFKIEKSFTETDLGCTQAVADVVRPKLAELNLSLHENTQVAIPGFEGNVMTYYVRHASQKTSRSKKSKPTSSKGR